MFFERLVRAGCDKAALTALFILANTLSYTLPVSAIPFGVLDKIEFQRIRLVVKGGIESNGIARTDNSPAEPAYMLLRTGEHIIVPCPAPHIEKLSPSLHVQDVLWGDLRRWEVRDRSSHGAVFRADHSSSTGSDSFQRQIEPFGQFAVQQRRVNVNSEIFGSGFAAVDPRRSEPPGVLVSFGIQVPFWMQSRSEYECPSSFDQCHLGQPSLVLASTPKSPSESGDSDGTQGGHQLRVRLEGLREIRQRERSEMIGSALFIVGVIVIFAYLIFGFEEERRQKKKCR